MTYKDEVEFLQKNSLKNGMKYHPINACKLLKEYEEIKRKNNPNFSDEDMSEDEIKNFFPQGSMLLRWWQDSKSRVGEEIEMEDLEEELCSMVQ